MTSIQFDHGLGDCSNFAHQIPLYIRRGYEIEVECAPDKEPVFRAAGARLVHNVPNGHPWPHASWPGRPNHDEPWNGKNFMRSIYLWTTS
jgi:hypothetical protein